MRSIIVTELGGPEVLALRDVPVPEPSGHLVRVRVKAAGINYADIMQRVGLYPNGPQPPYGAGFEICGVIEKLGDDPGPWRVGDAVMGFCVAGYSEYVLADARALMPKPDGLDFIHAAAIPCQFLTAYHVLLTLGRLQSGQTVLLQAAAGGLGVFMVQIARNIGARVIGTCSSPDKIALLQRLGCQHPINYNEADFEEEVRAITNGAGCDLAIETVGGQVFDKTVRCVRSRGHLIVVGAASGKPRGIQTMLLLVSNLTVSGFHLMGYSSDLAAMANAQRHLDQWLAEGRLEIVVNHTYPLEQAADAHRLISDRKSTGKVVLTLPD